MAQFPFSGGPFRAFKNLVYALRKPVALHAKTVNRDAWRLQQVHTTDLSRIHVDRGSQFVELRLESEANVYGAMSAHGTARRLVGKHAISVVTDVGNVV